MPELIEELNRLADLWIQHANGMTTGDPMNQNHLSREAGYASGLSVCSRQLRDLLTRAMDDA